MVLALANFVGKLIKDICGKYDNGSTGNNCAHFVGHALAYRLPGAALCSNCAGTLYTYAERTKGFCIRVDQIYNSLSNRGGWPQVSPTSQCIVVATIHSNLTDKDNHKIGDNPRKHIGIFYNGNVCNYSNTQDWPTRSVVDGSVECSN